MRGSRRGRGNAGPPSCDQIEPLLEAYHDSALGEVETGAVRQHLSGCAQCAARLGAFARVDSLVREPSQPAPPAELRRRLYARIAKVQGSAIAQPALDQAEPTGMSAGAGSPA